MPVFVDTNVLVYGRDATDPVKHARASEWVAHLWERGNGRLSMQVLQEYYVTTTRKLRPGLEPEDTTPTSWTSPPGRPSSPTSRCLHRLQQGRHRRIGTEIGHSPPEAGELDAEDDQAQLVGFAGGACQDGDRTSA